MSNEGFEELKRELVEAKYLRYDSSNKEPHNERHPDRPAKPTPAAQPSQEDRHPSLFKSQEARRHQ